MITANPDPGLMFFFLLLGNHSAICSSRSEVCVEKRLLWHQSGIEFTLLHKFPNFLNYFLGPGELCLIWRHCKGKNCQTTARGQRSRPFGQTTISQRRQATYGKSNYSFIFSRASCRRFFRLVHMYTKIYATRLC